MNPRLTNAACLLTTVAALHACTRADPHPRQRNRDATDKATEMKLAFKESWSTSIDPSVSDEDWEASAFSDELVLIQTADGVLGLDGRSGTVRWTDTGWYVHPAGQVQPLYRIGDLSGAAELRELVEIDPASGDALRRVTLEPPIRGRNLRVTCGTGLIVIRVHNDDGAEGFVVFDAATGKQRWSAPAVGTELSPPLILADRFIVRTPYQAYSLADGKALWTRSGECCDAAAIDDGSRVYVRTSAEPNAFVELDRDGRETRTFSGKLLASTETHFAFDTGHSLRVMEHGGTEPVVELPYAPDLALGAVSLAADAVHYFDPDADTVWRQNLVSGDRAVIAKLTKYASFSTEKSTIRQPYLGFPLRASATHLFMFHRSVLHAFEIATTTHN